MKVLVNVELFEASEANRAIRSFVPGVACNC